MIIDALAINELREKLADLEHDRWSRWERYRDLALHKSKSGLGVDNIEDTWERKRETPYSELTEQEKESDRAEADKTLEVLEPFIEQAIHGALKENIAHVILGMADEFTQVIKRAAGDLAKHVHDNMDPRDDVVVVLGNCADAFRILIERTAESVHVGLPEPDSHDCDFSIVAAMPKPEGEPDPEGG